MAIGMEFKTMQDISGAGACNRSDYILVRQHNNIFLLLEQKMHDMVT